MSMQDTQVSYRYQMYWIQLEGQERRLGSPRTCTAPWRKGFRYTHLGEGCVGSMPKRSARGSDRSCSRIRARTVLLDFSTSRGDSLVTDCRAACFFPQLHSHVFSISRISDSFRTIPACPQGVMGLPSAHRSDIRRPAVESP